MALFFFHVVNDTFTLLDHDGTHLLDAEEARLHARTIIGAILADELKSNKRSVHLSIMVDDAEHTRIANIKSTTKIVESISPFTE